MNDRNMPHSLEAERMILGQALQEPEVLGRERDRLRPCHFWRPDHGALWAFLCGLWDAKVDVDLVTLPRRLDEQHERFRQSGGKEGRNADRLGGISYILELPGYAPSTANHGLLAEELIALWQRREVIKAAERLTIALATGEDIATLVGQAVADMTRVLGDVRDRGVVRYGDDAFHETINRVYDRTEARMAGGDRVPGLSWGSPGLDLVTGGLRPGQMAVLAARPGQGKSLRALDRAHAWAAEGCRPVLYSVEMTGAENVERAVVMAAGIRSFNHERGVATQVRDGFDTIEFAEDVLEAGRRALQGLPVTIVPCSGMSIVDIRADFESRRAREGADTLIVDYVQRLRATDQRASRQEQVSVSSTGCKDMAQELEIGALVLAQLSRAAEGVEPELHHLRESGSLEQDADQVHLLYRPETWYMDPMEIPADLRGRAFTKVAKARGGTKGLVQHEFVGDILTFRNLE